MAQSRKELKYRGTEKGKLTRKVGHFKERFPQATSDEIRNQVVLAIGKKCFYCRKKLTLESISADHGISVKNGGKSNLFNMRLICKECNRAKGDFNEDFFGQMIKLAEEFDEAKNLLNKLRRASLVFGRRW